MMTLARYLKERRLSQEQFARELGVSQSSVSKWIAGQPPKISTMRRIGVITSGAVPPEVWFQSPSDAAASQDAA